MAGSTGDPGDHYAAIWVGVARYDDGLYEARAKYGRGINRGQLQEEYEMKTRARGGTIDEAIEEITPDIMEWEDERITPASRRAAIREAKITAQDWLEENESEEEE